MAREFWIRIPIVINTVTASLTARTWRRIYTAQPAMIAESKRFASLRALSGSVLHTVGLLRACGQRERGLGVRIDHEPQRHDPISS
jgi:hypothetical protein